MKAHLQYMVRKPNHILISGKGDGKCRKFQQCRRNMCVDIFTYNIRLMFNMSTVCNFEGSKVQLTNMCVHSKIYFNGQVQFGRGKDFYRNQ